MKVAQNSPGPELRGGSGGTKAEGLAPSAAATPLEATAEGPTAAAARGANLRRGACFGDGQKQFEVKV